MRNLVTAALAIAFTPGMAAAQTCTVALTDANVWDGTAFVKQTLAMRDGRFVNTTPDMPSIDAKALHLIPPFADAHTHNIDTVYGGPTAGFHQKAIAQGVFYATNPNNIRPAGATPAAATGLVEFQAAGGGLTRPGGHPEPLYNWMAGQGWLGPMTAEMLKGQAFHHATTPAEAVTAVALVKANGAEIIKLYLLNHGTAKSGGLDADSFNAAVVEAKRLGLRPVVHIENAADFRLAAKAGVFAIMHLPYSAPDAERTADSLMISADDAAIAAKAGIIIVPTATVVFAKYDGVKLAEMQAVQRHNLTLLRDAGVRIAVGADNFALGLHDEINTLRSFALFDAATMINMATINGTQLAFPKRKLGKIAVDYEASFIGYFFLLVGNWGALREPAIGVRGGEVMIDTANLLAKACPSAKAG